MNDQKSLGKGATEGFKASKKGGKAMNKRVEHHLEGWQTRPPDNQGLLECVNFHQPSESSGRREWRPPSQEASLSKQQSETERGWLGIPVMYDEDDDDAHALPLHLLHRSVTELVPWLEGGLEEHKCSIYELPLVELAEQSANVGRW